jgi:hypothetical protein
MTSEPKKLTRFDYKELHRMPVLTVEMHLERIFSDDEFEKLSFGLMPMSMDEKWYMFLEDDWLYFHRSWTGKCIYQLMFEKKGSDYLIKKALVNRDETQYKETDLEHDERLIMFIIENLLLGNKTPFPIRADDDNYPKGAIQHSFSGTGYSETRIDD